MADGSVDVEKILKAFKKDSAKARATYEGKRLRVFGKVFYAGQSQAGAPMLMLDRLAGDFTTPSVYFPKTAKEEVAGIASGEVVHVECRCDGVDGSMLMLNDATLLDAPVMTAAREVSLDALARGVDGMLEMAAAAGLDLPALASMRKELKAAAKAQRKKRKK